MDIAIYILSIIALSILLGSFIGFGSAKLIKELSKLDIFRAIVRFDKFFSNMIGTIVWLIIIILIWLSFNPIFFYVIIETYFKDKKSEKNLTGDEGKLILLVHFPIFLLWIAGALKVISIIF